MFDTTAVAGKNQPAAHINNSSMMPSSLDSSPDAPAWLRSVGEFARRHIGPNEAEIQEMLKLCGFASLGALSDAVAPRSIRSHKPLALPPALSEQEALARLKELASKNQVFRSYIGMGYYGCIMPPVIQRNILENPGWYTQYTPYQAEIAQGRLEALLNYQTLVCDLTGMEIANASLLDEGTAAAEAMTMCLNVHPGSRKRFFASSLCHPQTLDVVKTRAWALGIEVVVGDHAQITAWDGFFGALLSYPNTQGVLCDYKECIDRIHADGALAVVLTDLMALAVLRPPGEFGADIVAGNSQRFGVPPGYGGPHAAFFATRNAFKRQMPGRLVGVSKDSRGRPAMRLALQTREQHIRREKATSNICTAQVLLAILASMYAVYHGPGGLKKIALRIHGLTKLLALGLSKLGYASSSDACFDTIHVELGSRSGSELAALSTQARINLRWFGQTAVGISLDETVAIGDVVELWSLFNGGKALPFNVSELLSQVTPDVPAGFERCSAFLTSPSFNRYHSETEMLRYIRRLESRDLSLTASMIPLGSCTMKLNPTAAMYPISWPEFAHLHPFAPVAQAQGYHELFEELSQWLAETTGFAGVSLQPNAGSQGEYAGLVVIRKYLEHNGQSARKVCLIPQSAHGTNPASAAMAGMRVVPVLCDSLGNIDIADLREKCAVHKDALAALMVTYPSTHGVFEEGIKEICEIVHAHGGQVYMDGANMNAQVGLCSPGSIGADVCHLNLHKTFAIPHGGGGPGVGPICVASHLVAFLPGHAVIACTAGGQTNADKSTATTGAGAVSSAPWGSAGILPIPYTYIRMMGPDGLLRATQAAILNANYIAKRLDPYFPVLYKGKTGLVAHECILDLREFKCVTVEDVAKRLMDYGFHAPTISWPVAGTMMVEPTESESKEELDRFCDAMIRIHAEIETIESGRVSAQNNLLKNAPHTADMLLGDNWTKPYSRDQAAYPTPSLRSFKFWPACGRIDNVFGDRNPICTCSGMDPLTNV
jgi:glycine dehydrogenase